MPLTREETDRLRSLHRRLGQLALQPDDPFYVDVHDPAFEDAAGEDIVGQLQRDVAWSEAPSLSFMSGFRGAGKSTQLNRLARELDAEGYAVLKFDVEDYLETRIPITAVHLMYALAAGARESAAARGWLSASRLTTYIERFSNWVKGLRAQGNVTISAPLGEWSPIDFEASLRRDPTFRDELDRFLRDRSVEARDQANAFLGELQDAIRSFFRAEGRDWLGVVLIVDSLDHARSETQFQQVRDALREIFDMQVALLRFDGMRTLFCVPPWLRPAGGTVRQIFNVKVADRAEGKVEGGYALLREILRCRLPEGEAAGAFLADPDLDRLIGLSGGHLRDFLRLLDDVVLRVGHLPASATEVDRAVTQVRSQFLPLADDERAWLARIAVSHELTLPSQDDWEGLAALLDRHLVLRYPNEQAWYAVHPLVATELRPDARTP